MSYADDRIRAALLELLAVHDLEAEYSRRKQRRAFWLAKNPGEVAAVHAMKAEIDIRRPRAWAGARYALLTKPQGT